jgi:hypothetical protein
MMNGEKDELWKIRKKAPNTRSVKMLFLKTNNSASFFYALISFDGDLFKIDRKRTSFAVELLKYKIYARIIYNCGTCGDAPETPEHVLLYCNETAE